MTREEEENSAASTFSEDGSGPACESGPEPDGRRSCRRSSKWPGDAFVAAVPVGASAEKKKELFYENHVILKEEEVQNAGRS